MIVLSVYVCVCACVWVHSRVCVCNVCVSLSSLACMIVCSVSLRARVSGALLILRRKRMLDTPIHLHYTTCFMAGSRQERSGRPVLVSRRVGSVQSVYFFTNKIHKH